MIFIRLLPLRNGHHVKFTKVGVSREREGVAQIFFHISVYFDKYYRFDSSADFYGAAPS